MDYFSPKVTLMTEIIALPVQRQAFLYVVDSRLSRKNANCMCTIRWNYFSQWIKSMQSTNLHFDAVFRIRDNLVSENKSRLVLTFDVAMSVLLKLKGGTTCFFFLCHIFTQIQLELLQKVL